MTIPDLAVLMPPLLHQLLLCCSAHNTHHVLLPYCPRRRSQAAEQLSELQHYFNELAQEVQQHAELVKQRSVASATCIAYDGAANQKVYHAVGAARSCHNIF
jgi:hypothetical protein